MFKGPQETVRDNKSSSYLVFELPGINCSFFLSAFFSKSDLSNLVTEVAIHWSSARW